MANTKITSRVIADNAVTSSAIADGAITEAKLASGVGGVAGIVSSADATAITIDSSENVTFTGSGTFGSNVTALTSFNSSTGNDLRLNAGSVNRDIFMQVNGSTLMTVQGSTGNVGIGNASPQVKFVVGDGTNGTSLEVTPNEASGFVNMNSYDRGSSAWRTMNIGGDVVTFNTNGETQFLITNNNNADSEDCAVLKGVPTDGTSNVDVIRMTKMGYGGSYQVTQFGQVGGGRNISLMYDPSTNTSGGFSGNGECVVGNTFRMIASAANNNGYYGLIGSNSSNQLLLGGNYTVQGHITIDNDDGEIRMFDQQSVQSNYTGLGQCQGVYSDTISAFACSRNSSGSALYVSKQNTGTSDMVAFHVAGNDVGEITTNGSNSTTFTGTSDYRLKENVEPLPNATARLNALNPVAFDWIRDGQEDEGFLAHEVQAQVPYAATGVKDEVYTEENTPPEMIEKLGQPKYQKVDYGRLTPLLVKALQESNAKIAELETRIETLENS